MNLPARAAHDSLRRATRDDHGRVDAHFPRGLPDAPTYRIYLRGMHRFVADMAAALRIAPEPGDEALLARCGAAHAALAADLSDVQADPVPPAGALPAVGKGATRLGWEYVLAGSAMGARILGRDAARLGHCAQGGARFLAVHAAAPGWPEVLGRIEATGGDPAGAAALHEGATAAFAFADQCFFRARDLEECLTR